MANRIMLNQTSYHGAGAIAEIVTEAKSHGFKKAFVCSDADLIKFGITKKVTDLLEQNGLAYEIFSDLDAALAEKVNAASEGNHAHANKDALDGITAEKVAAWDAKANASDIPTISLATEADILALFA